MRAAGRAESVALQQQVSIENARASPYHVQQQEDHEGEDHEEREGPPEPRRPDGAAEAGGPGQHDAKEGNYPGATPRERPPRLQPPDWSRAHRHQRPTEKRQGREGLVDAVERRLHVRILEPQGQPGGVNFQVGTTTYERSRADVTFKAEWLIEQSDVRRLPAPAYRRAIQQAEINPPFDLRRGALKKPV